jgi:hypothetical protein
VIVWSIASNTLPDEVAMVKNKSIVLFGQIE